MKFLTSLLTALAVSISSIGYSTIDNRVTGNELGPALSYAEEAEKKKNDPKFDTFQLNQGKREEVWDTASKILQLAPETEKGLALSIAYYVELYEKEKIPSDLVLCIFKTESYFRPNAKNKRDPVFSSYGLGQQKYFWGEHFKIKGSLYDIGTNTQLTYLVLDYYMNKYNNIDHTVSAYNRGETAMNLDIARGRDPTMDYKYSKGKLKKTPKDYMKKVMGCYNSLKSENKHDPNVAN